MPFSSVYCIDPTRRKQSTSFVLSHDSSLF